jgi:hypothetical protein
MYAARAEEGGGGAAVAAAAAVVAVAAAAVMVVAAAAEVVAAAAGRWRWRRQQRGGEGNGEWRAREVRRSAAGVRTALDAVTWCGTYSSALAESWRQKLGAPQRRRTARRGNIRLFDGQG